MSDPRIPPAEITGLQGAMVKRYSRKMLGEVPEPLGMYWHNPRVLRTFLTISAKAQKWDSCDEGLKSLAHMAAVALVGCSFCLDLGYFMAQNEGLDLTKAREVPRWRESDVFTPRERDVMEYAEAMSGTPPTVTDDLVERLRIPLGEAALVELTAHIALANFAARSNLAFGIHAQGFAASCGLPPLAPASDASTDLPLEVA